MTPATLPPTHAQRMEYVNGRMKSLGKTRTQKALLIAKEDNDLISGELMIALAIRESGLRNVLGDYKLMGKVPILVGRARGAHQIHDEWHMPFLKSVRGCLAAKTIPEFTRLNWIPIPGTNAGMRGMCPSWEDGTRYAIKILNGHIDKARDKGVTSRVDLVRIAIASYNCGFARAYQAYIDGDVDAPTTGDNYSRDTLMRRDEVREWLDKHPNWRV